MESKIFFLLTVLCMHTVLCLPTINRKTRKDKLMDALNTGQLSYMIRYGRSGGEPFYGREPEAEIVLVPNTEVDKVQQAILEKYAKLLQAQGNTDDQGLY